MVSFLLPLVFLLIKIICFSFSVFAFDGASRWISLPCVSREILSFTGNFHSKVKLRGHFGAQIIITRTARSLDSACASLVAAWNTFKASLGAQRNWQKIVFRSSWAFLHTKKKIYIRHYLKYYKPLLYIRSLRFSVCWGTASSES